jgi:FkbM family methyltransferase
MKKMDLINIQNCSIGEDEYLKFEFSYNGELSVSEEIVITDLENNLVVYKDIFQLLPASGYWISLPPMLAMALGKVKIEFKSFNLKYDYDFQRPTIFTISGKKFEPYTEGDVAFVTFMEVKIEEVYKKGNIEVKPGDTVLDIGANYGFFSLYAVEKGASKIISLEPFDSTYKCLEKNTESFEQIITVNAAISSEEGEAKFVLNSDYSGSSYLLSNVSISDDGGVFITPDDHNIFSVKTTTINKIIEQYNIDKIDFLKVDCEGGELDLFKTITDENLSKVKNTVIEYHSKEIGEFVTNKLISAGLTIYEPKPIDKMGMIYAFSNINEVKKINKIGVLLSAYNSEYYIDECLQPWMELKGELDISFACVSGMYKEYIDFGFKSRNKGTLSKLVNYELDFLISTGGSKCLMDENGSKNMALNALKNECDLVWILDSDEFYTKQQIKNILNYIDFTPEYDWYSVNLKNSTFEKHLWIDGFCPPRIFRTDRNDGLSHFYFDNHIVYNNGDVFDHKPNLNIPRNIAWVKHYSWLNSDTRSKEKVKYQELRFSGACSFKWNDSQKLYFSDDFYNSRGLEKPILHETIDFLSDEFTIDFSRNENKFYIKNVIKEQELNFRFFNGQDGNLIYETNMNLSPGVDFFCYISYLNFFEIEGFNKFRVEVLSNNKIIHNEFIHIKY